MAHDLRLPPDVVVRPAWHETTLRYETISGVFKNCCVDGRLTGGARETVARLLDAANAAMGVGDDSLANVLLDAAQERVPISEDEPASTVDARAVVAGIVAAFRAIDEAVDATSASPYNRVRRELESTARTLLAGAAIEACLLIGGYTNDADAGGENRAAIDRQVAFCRSIVRALAESDPS